MRRRTGILILVLAAVLAAPVLAQQKKLQAQKLADGVWAASPDKGANVGWFLLGDGVVAVDSGGDSETGKQILDLIAETTANKPVRVLILTHAHADHTGGARAFAAAGARILCHESVNGQILALLGKTAEANDPLAGKPNLHPVVESISERSILVDGIHDIQVYFLGPAHTKGDLIIYLPTDKILFSGDVALNGLYPFMQSPDVDPVGWERVLMAINRVSPEKMVPGHGEIGPVTGLSDSQAYIQSVVNLAKKIVDHGVREDMVEAEIRAPENQIPKVTTSPTHIANVKAVVKILREKATRKPTPAASGTPKPAATPAATPATK